MCGLKLAEVTAGKEQQIFKTNAFIVLWDLLRSAVHWIHYIGVCILFVLMYWPGCKTWLKTAVCFKICEWGVFLPKIVCFLLLLNFRYFHDTLLCLAPFDISGFY